MEPHTGFNTLDFIVLGVLLLSGGLAFYRGFVREAFSLGAWALAYLGAAKYHALAEPWLRNHIHNKEAVIWTAALVVFLSILVLMTILGSFVSDTIKGQTLTAIDRSLGFVFGVLRGALVVCIIYLAVVSVFWPDIDKPKQEQTQEAAAEKEGAPHLLLEARSRPFMAYGAAELKHVIPEKAIEKTSQEFIDQKAAIQKTIDQEKLEMLSTPTPTSPKADETPNYDDKSRSKLDQLINNQTGKP